MKKYLTHFIYILIIAALAIASRIKTSELESENQQYETKLVRYRQMAEESAALARMAQNEAEQQAHYAAEAAAEARKQAELAKRALDEYQENK